MYSEMLTKKNISFFISILIALLGLILSVKLWLANVPITTFVDSSLQEFQHELLSKKDKETIKLDDVSAILIAKKDGSIKLLTSSPLITHSYLSSEELLQLASSSVNAYANHMGCSSPQKEYCFTGMYNGKYYANVCWCE